MKRKEVTDSEFKWTKEMSHDLQDARRDCKNRTFGKNNSSELPWYSWREWKAVKDHVVGGRTLEAASRMRIWAEKCNGALPHCVDSTYCLMTVDSKNEREYCLAMSMAIIRFVDGFAQMIDEKEYFTSINIQVKKLGIPNELISIRHEAIHGRLPKYSKLRSAVHIALDWLIKKYWEPQETIIDYFELSITESACDDGELSIGGISCLWEISEIIIDKILCKCDPVGNLFVFENIKKLKVVRHVAHLLELYLGDTRLPIDEKSHCEAWKEIFKAR